MKLQVLQENFAKALSVASRFTSNRSQLPVLGNVLLSARENKLLVSATNLETSVAISIGAQVKEKGELTVPSRVIAETVANLAPGTLELESEKEHLKITRQNFSSKVLGMNSSDFPEIPQTINKAECLLISMADLSKALSQVIYSCSADESRPILTGVLFIFEKNGLSLVATDGFRLSQKTIVLGKAVKSQKIILPKGVLLELSRLEEEGDELAFGQRQKENQVLFACSKVLLSSRVLEGDFPDFAKIIPKTSVYKTIVDKEDFLRAIKLASVFARDSANIVKLNLRKDSVKLSAESSQAGSQEMTIEAKTDPTPPEASRGEGFEIAFNYRFLEDFLREAPGEEVLMQFNNSSSPGVFTDPKDPNYLHLIMPVKIQG